MEAKQIYTLMVQANDLMREEHYEAALEVLDSIVADGEAAAIVCYMKGCAYMQMEQDELSHICFGKALELGMANKQLYINLGIIKTRIGNLLQAEQMFRQAAELDPVDALPLNRIILLRLSRRDFDGAEVVMEELMHRNPELVDGYHHKADLLLGTGRVEEALALLESVKVRFSANTLFTYDLCRALRRVGRAEEALSYLKEHEDIFKEDTDLVLLKKQQASLLVDLKRYDEAEPLWQQLYDLYGDRQAGMALTAQALGRQDAKTLLKIAQEMLDAQTYDDNHYICLYYKVIALSQLGDQEGAKEALYQAAQQLDELGNDHTGIKFRSLRANIRMELGRYEDALADVDTLVALAKKEPNATRAGEMLKQMDELKQIIQSRMNTFA